MTKTNKKGMLYLASITVLTILIAVFIILKGEDKSLEVEATTSLVVNHQIVKTQFNEVYTLNNQPKDKWQYMSVDVKQEDEIEQFVMTTGTNESKCIKVDVQKDLNTLQNDKVNGFAYISELTGDVIEKIILEDNSKQYFVHNGYVSVYQIPVHYNETTNEITVYSKQGKEVTTLDFTTFKDMANDLGRYKELIKE